MNTTIKTFLLIAILLFVSSCSSQASQPGTDSDADSQEAEPTPKAQANDHNEGEASPVTPI